ncbi:hypothetical protein CHLRE_10g433050v5 [Chlamydomonas reinhardtii]|uniref:Dynamin-type G domain-containing protein n=1 Tax=Chlamydomonas reinhardtii TaxID=3055 RepID=A0A2K3DA00_CHLRE|nr:uncharacterized protein CHLRE_10g433050v5 [Chlamydomonas reinhardtii]PNW77356.1 hypothetical protein CHLRE_10g433050v5 [Chlamydomonas reinhardtii]
MATDNLSRYQQQAASLSSGGFRDSTMTFSAGDDDLLDRSSKGYLRGHERLYDAYNELHTLAQSFNKPFDAPAILVVGHQTDGKSALVEGLMGFQFNSVGGGTKTRRPIAINMKYNGACSTPACFLKLEDGVSEQEMSLAELQAYIDADNAALEREQRFAAKEIVVRMEYKHCPNLTIIDTPGLISPAPGKKNCALQNCAAQVEEIVRAKAQVPEYVILCLEDCSDWSNATTRRLVMQVDPNLVRTVLVSTKFDTRIPQFARAADCEMFLRPSALDSMGMLGDGPFFTSVPSGRVGSGADCVFPSHDVFRERLADREATDVAELESKLARKLSRGERDHIGVGALRRYLEQLLQKRYLDAVPSIVPLLEAEQRATAARIEAVRRDLAGLNPEELKDKGRAFVDAFLNRLQQLLRGTITAPADKWGETLADEHARGGSFVSGSRALAGAHEAVPNAAMRLYGGAQFHRAMSEFRLVVGGLACPELSHEEIVNACGLDYEGGHDGVNYVRTACVIAVSKAKELLEPFIHQLGSRLAHVLRRLLHISLALMQQGDSGLAGGCGSSGSAHAAAALTDQFVRRVSSAFHAFLAHVEDSCKERCLEDLASTTRYVSWSLHTRNSRSLKQLLGRVRVTNNDSSSGSHPIITTGSAPGGINGGKAGGAMAGGATGLSREPSMTGGVGGGQAGSLSLPDMLEATLWNRNLTGVSEDIVRALVLQMFEGIRDHLVQAAELKFNCFFLMPLVDSFPARLRKDIECAYEEGLDEVFDAAAMRTALEARQAELQEELRRVERLQRKFHGIHSTLVHGPSLASGPTSRAITDLDASLMVSVAASPLAAALAGGGAQGLTSPDMGGMRPIGSRLAAAAAARTPDMATGKSAMGVSPAALSAGRKAMPSAAGAAAIAAGASLRQMTQAAPAGVERDRGERDAKDKAAVGGSGVADKVAAVQQLQQQQAMAGR